MPEFVKNAELSQQKGLINRGYGCWFQQNIEGKIEAAASKGKLTFSERS